jgi:hypothetical protein
VGLYEQYPILQRVKNTLNSVQNTEESTGKAQYAILKTSQVPGVKGRFGAYMNKFNWKALKNDPRLTAAQKKTVNKILVSLQVPARDEFRNRPALTFNTAGLTLAQVNKKVRENLARKKTRNNPVFQNSKNVFHNAKQTFNNPTFNLMAARQHRESFGN